MINEHDYELKIISWLSNMGWEYVDSNAMGKRRNSFSEVIDFSSFQNSFMKINNIKNEDLFNKVYRKVSILDEISLAYSNMTFLHFVQNGIRIKLKKDEPTKTYQLFDFKNIENNSFVVTNQFDMTSNSPTFRNQRPDIVLFINGLPISVIELKSPTIDELKSMNDAYVQLNENYKEYMPKLFVYNLFNVISNFNSTKIGAFTSSFDRFTIWKKPKEINPDAQHFFYSMFEKNILMDVIKNYSFYTEKNNLLIKIIPGYHQYFGVKNALPSVLKAIGTHKKGGIFWHTQGSGKSLSMVMMLKNILKKHKKLTSIIITDRKDLNLQLFNTFNSANKYLNQEPVIIDSRKQLTNILKNKKQNGIFFTTVQKFDSEDILSKRDDILIITDEAHRSHRNIELRKEIDIEKETVIDKKGYGFFIRKALPNATFVGFTGTPIESKDHNTIDVFGTYNSKYSIVDATNDYFVVPIRYESQKINIKINGKNIDIEKIYSKDITKIKKMSQSPSEAVKKYNKAILRNENIICAPDRMEKVAANFVQHYNSRKHILEGKAMFIAANRKAACNYYNLISKIDPSLKKKMRVIATSSSSDKPSMAELIKDDKYRVESAKEFKDPKSDFKIVIVVDMWLTGFDVPCLDSLYIDKYIKMHNLMQAVARVNRIYTSEINGITKDAGLIVDFIGIKNNLEKALAFYGAGISNIENLDFGVNVEKIVKQIQDIIQLIKKDYIPDVEIKYDLISGKTIDNNYIFDLIREVQNALIIKTKKSPQIQEKFIKLVQRIKQMRFSAINALEIKDKSLVNIFILIRGQMIKRSMNQINMSQKIDNMKKLIASAVIYTNTEALGDSKEKITLNSIINYLKQKHDKKDFNHLDLKESVVATKQLIEQIQLINRVKAEKIYQKLKQLIQKYEDGHLTLEEFKEILLQSGSKWHKELVESKKSGKAILELAFFDILKEEDENPDHPDKEKINAVVKELYEIVQNKLGKYEDLRYYHKSDSFKKEIRSSMIEVMMKHNYPPKIAMAKFDNDITKQIEDQIKNTESPDWLRKD